MYVWPLIAGSTSVCGMTALWCPSCSSISGAPNSSTGKRGHEDHSYTHISRSLAGEHSGDMRAENFRHAWGLRSPGSVILNSATADHIYTCPHPCMQDVGTAGSVPGCGSRGHRASGQRGWVQHGGHLGMVRACFRMHASFTRTRGNVPPSACMN